METLHPGVYVQEIPSGLRPIEGVSTSNAAFIGKAQMGPVSQAKLVTTVQEFENTYGGYLADSSLAHAVHHFFNNGGKKAYIVRVTGAGAFTADISIKDRKGAKTITIRAANPGEWGNKLDIVITDSIVDPGNEFTLEVYQDRTDLVPPLLPLLLETHKDLSMNPAAKNYVEKVINANSKYIVAIVDKINNATASPGTSRSGVLTVGNAAALLKLGAANGGTEPSPTPAGDRGLSQSGATPATSLPADRRKFLINLDGDGAQEITIPLTAATGDDIATAIVTAVKALTPNDPTKRPAYDGFTADFDDTVAPGNPSYKLNSGTTGPGSSVLVTDAPNTISLPAGTKKFVIEIDGDGPHVVTLPPAALADGAAIAGAIQAAVQALIPKRASNTSAFRPPPGPGFTCTYENSPTAENPSFLLTSGTVAGDGRLNSSVRVSDAPSDNVAGTLKLGLKHEGREISGAAILRPARSKDPGFAGDTEYHLGDASVIGNVVGPPTPPTFGADGATPQAGEHKDGFTALNVVRDVNIVAVPGIGDAEVVSFGATYCALRGDCFFIGDTKSDDDTVEEAKTFIDGLDKTSYGAVYFPWLKASDPTGQSPEPIKVPPSGFVAGLFARIDARRGVWKAPAGTEAGVTGAVGLVVDITDAKQDFLNPIGMNVIRQFPGAGRVVWGSRTLATRQDPEYRYVPVRRTAIYLEQSIYNGIQWAVFEPNDEDLWASLRLNIGAFMMLQFRAGAFQGKSAKDAFFVKCDNETTTQGDIDAGIVNILVGFAPLKPAEFVILKLTQIVGQQA